MSEATITQPQTNSEPQTESLQHQSFLKKWGGLVVLSLGLAIVIIDTTLLNVSLGAIIKDLNTNIQDLQWVITIYALALAALTITGGRLGDLFGRRKMFMLGAIIFAIGSFVASISHNIPTLLMGESIIEGIGAALMMPATASLVIANFKGSDRAKAFGVWGAVAGASSAVGPLLGGYLTSHFSWRWGFRINIFIALIVIIGSLILLKESRDERKPKLDWLGVILSATGLLSLVFAIIESTTYGWWKAKEVFSVFGHTLSFGSLSVVPFAFALGAVILALFFWWEMRLEKQGKSPLVSMHLFQNTQFTIGTIVISILTLAMTGQIFALPIFLQSVKHLNAFDTGLALLPLSAALLVVAPLTGFLSKKIPPKYFILAGLALAVVAAFMLRAVLSVDVTVSQLIPGLIVYGIGMGMVFAPISNYTLSAVPVEMSGEASGVNNTFRQIGASLGAAIIGAAVLTSVGLNLGKSIQASNVIPENLKPAIIKNVTSPTSDVEFGGNSLKNQASPAIAQEITTLANEATTTGSRDAYVYNAMFALIAIAVGLFLPNSKAGHEHVEVVDKTRPKPWGKLAASALLIIIAIAGGIIILKHGTPTVNLTTTALNQTAEDIRNVFAPPVNIPTPTPSPTPTNSVQGISPRGEDVQPSPTPTPVIQMYTNPSLGFEMQISNQWQAQAGVQNNQIIFVNGENQQYSVESFSGVSDTLDTVQTQLSQSPSVTNLSRTTFQNEPALIFHTTNGQQGLAVIHNNKLFYIFGPNLNSPPLTSFKFI